MKLNTTKVAIALLISIMAIAACSDIPALPEGVAKVTPISSQEKIVHRFIEAFSAHNADDMAALCDDNVQWGYVSDKGYSPAGRGREQLVKEMNDYFTATPGVRSRVEGVVANGDTIAFTERVFWMANDQEKTQSSLAVYQVKNNLITSVWYYPEQP